jgi:tRNA modification GTPase
MQKLRTSQLVLAVFDGSQELKEDDLKLLCECKGRRAVAVINKTDLEMKTDPEKIKEYIDDVVYLSAMNGDGITRLQTVLERLLGTAELDTSSGMLSSERQYSCCRSAAESLKEAVDGIDMGVTLDAVNVSIDYAIEKLLELTGEKAREAVVNEVFSKFCVGK